MVNYSELFDMASYRANKLIILLLIILPINAINARRGIAPLFHSFTLVFTRLCVVTEPYIGSESTTTHVTEEHTYTHCITHTFLINIVLKE